MSARAIGGKGDKMTESCFNCRGTPNRNLDSDKLYCWKKQKWVYEFKECEEYQEEITK